MVSSEPAATRRPSISNPRGTKRGACDRCRGQKLRCLPGDQGQEPSKTTCVRCRKAGATCSFSLAKRPGRPSTSSASLAQQRRDDGGDCSVEDETSLPTGINRSSQNYLNGRNGDIDQDHEWQAKNTQRTGQLSRESTAERRREEESQEGTQTFSLSPSSLLETASASHGIPLEFSSLAKPSTIALPWCHETLPSIYGNEIGDVPGLDAFSPKYGWPFQDYLCQAMDIQLPTPSSSKKHEQSRDEGAVAYATPAQTYSTGSLHFGPPDETMEIDFPCQAGQIGQSRITNASDTSRSEARCSERERQQVSASLETSSMDTSVHCRGFAHTQVATENEEEIIMSQDIQHRRVQELSELAMSLYAQVLASDPENQPSGSGTKATAFQDQLVGNVLKSSATFLELLASFSASTTPSSPTCPPPTPSAHFEKSPSIRSDSEAPSSMASFLDQDDGITSKPTEQSQREFSANQLSDPKLSPPADLTTVLQLLTCYMRIMHLHSIMHAHILDYVLNFLPHQPAQSIDPIPPVFPGMQIGGVSLDRFGTYQVKLLLQISLRVLGDIELALGLPDEYRVGKRKSGVKGVLEASVSAGFVRCLMREEAWRGKRVELVRERLANLRRVLKGD